MSYQIIEPDTKKTSYQPNEKIDWHIQIPDGMGLKNNSIYIHCDWVIDAGSALNANTGTLKYDQLVGCATFFDNWICKTAKSGSMPTVDNYSMIVKAYHLANLAKDDIGWNTDNECIFGDDQWKGTPATSLNSWYRSKRSVDPDKTFNTLDRMGSMHKPAIPFNQVISGQLNKRTCGDYIQIQHRLTSAPEALTSNTNITYSALNLRCYYELAPDDGSDNVTMMNFSCDVPDIKTSVYSGNKEISAMSVDGVMMLPKLSANYAVMGQKLTDLDDMGITRLQFTYNDISNQYHEYPFDNPLEIQYNAFASFNANDMRKYYQNAEQYNANKNLIAGMRFPGLINIGPNGNRAKINYMIENSKASGAVPYKLFVVWRGYLQL